jgi:DNA helicase HerA-like ATPase
MESKEKPDTTSVFDDMAGRFQARLKALRTMTKSSSGTAGTIEATTNYAILEAKFDRGVLDRLNEPSFLAIERESAEGKVYMVYEVFSVSPMHFQMLGVSSSVPLQIREEFLDRVSESWNDSVETWIDISAVATGYRLRVDAGFPSFARSHLIPLYGSRAHLLSDEAVSEFICVDGGMVVGEVSGFNVDLRVDPDSLARYHLGIFGFSGVGKSNLTANLIRKLMAQDPTLKVCVLDVSGEYPVHLVDMLESSQLFTTEDFGDDIEIFAQSQVLPETLEKRLPNGDWLSGVFKKLLSQGRIKVVELSELGRPWNLEKIYDIVSTIAEDRKSGYLAAEKVLVELQQHFVAKGHSRKMELSKLGKEEIDFIVEELTSLKGKVHQMSGTVKDLEEAVAIVLAVGTSKEVETHGTPEDIAHQLLTGKDRLFVIYTPDPEDARVTATRFLDRLLYLKKVTGLKQKVLVVLDEAQEFAPGEPRGSAIDSSRAVEALLRQGRKYRAFALISTQRVAKMNTNALQQLHSYFVSTLPRNYDRMVIAESFSLDYSVLDKTSQLSTGEWLFVSYKATRQRNVPVFIKTENNEEAVYDYARKLSG